MTSDIEDRKKTAVAQAAALMAARFDSGESVAIGAFLEALYEHAPPADIAARSPEDLAGGALALGRFGARRAPGEALVRVYNPAAARDGWSSAHTIVEIVNDDMPFLVDSVSAAINDRGRVVQLVIHPVIAVSRDKAGQLMGFGAASGGARESWMQIEIARERSATARSALAEALAGVLGDVRAAVSDWQPMRAALVRLSDEVGRTAPGQLPLVELDEGSAFLRWLDDDHLVLLGMRDYDFSGGETQPPLGILREPGYRVFGGLRDLGALPPAVRDFVRRPELVIVGKTDRRSTVHRRAPMDAIGVRRFDAEGEVSGLCLFVGLFTSTAYTADVRRIPIVCRKVERVLVRSGLAAASHDGKALVHILDTFPRDELFQASEDWLYDTAIGVLNLQERQRVALFVRRDPLERYVSCLVYVPRERYDTGMRRDFASILEEAFAGTISTFYTQIDDSLLARVNFIIRANNGEAELPVVDVAALEARLAEAGRSWLDRVEAAAEDMCGEVEAHRRLSRIASFPADYQTRTTPGQAVADLASIEKVLADSPLEASLHPRDGETTPGLRLYRRAVPVPLSDVLPVLENLGLRIVAEDAYRVDSAEGGAAWVHEFVLADGTVPASLTAPQQQNFETALVAAATGAIENDGFNRLVLRAGLTARQTTILRLYCKVLRQAGSAFSQAYMEDALAAHPGIARRLVTLFELRFSLTPPKGGALDIATDLRAIHEELDQVESLDEDRILRGFLLLILKSLRTNYFQPAADGSPKPYLSVKLASSEIDLLPLPRPLFEIYVYSPRMEGVHMRAGRVARGGIRWSDRREDFRTEILGLMKAQTVKNAVIIPVGSKGGFVLKQPPAPGPNFRAELQTEGIECYKLLIHGLLDLTDNTVADSVETHHIEPPRDVVRHDPDDPYLVVAADKGTATFSDTANAIALEYGFWLGDAFASGGSAGYDHKEIGITSRGAWELVKRHFRELGADIQSTDFTVVGVGDMGGDVFGNGMLQSRHIRLVGAFNHLHVFVDPEPDAATSYAERKRLFANPRLGWSDYDRGLISPGGGVFERSAKSIAVTPEMKRVFGIAVDDLTPAELIRQLLRAEVDLLFFGGIGTFVKARAETHTQVGDKANDALRIDGEEMRARVVGEGANLGVTERGRIAYAQKGGRIDTDAIDNSAGVSMSDHEVNIKILLGHALATGALAAPERETLLAEMTDDVAELVLRDNYLQGEALSVAEARGQREPFAALDRQARMIRELEKSGRLDRALEFLPDETEIAARAAARKGLTRPELAVLLAYAKMSLDEELLRSELPDAPELAAELRLYFPPALRDRFAAQIAAHPLRREIIATVVANDVVNRGGLTFVHDLAARTGRGVGEIARAYRIVREAYGLPALWAAIEALDNKIAARVSYQMLLDIADIVEHAATWLLRAGRVGFSEIARSAPSVERLSAVIGDMLPADERALLDRRVAALAEAGVPPPVAERVGGIVFLTTAFEIGDIAGRSGQPIDRAAGVFYGVGARFALDGLRDAARRLPAETQWQKAAVDTLIDDFYSLQADLAERVLKGPVGAASDIGDPIAAWAATRTAQLAPAEAIAAELHAAPAPDLAMLVVAGRQLRQVLG